MTSKTRRDYIKEILDESKVPKKGQELAKELGVTRQVIVKDIAILRAAGMKIVATSEGYIIPKSEKSAIEKIVAVCHDRENIEDELKTIIKYGGIVKDVVVEHPLYGEIKAMIMVKTPYDVEKFVQKIKEKDAEPLLLLTRGVHLHTIEIDNNEDMKKIINELRNKGYLID